MRRLAWICAGALCAGAAFAPVWAHARQSLEGAPRLSFYGVPGLVETPDAAVMPDGTLSATLSAFGSIRHTAINYQFAPRLSGTFRYSRFEGLFPEGREEDAYYDRSFDLKFQILEETARRPALAVGLTDFLGTGLLESEYLVASKTVAPGLTLSGGIGWGRLGGDGALGRIGSRPTALRGEGGIPNVDRWFRGPVSGFGGLRYAPPDARWSAVLDYSPDPFEAELADGIIEHETPWNFGLDYRFRNGAQLSLYSLHGAEIGAQLSIHLNPHVHPVPSGLEPAPLPVAPRQSAGDLGWVSDGATAARSRDALAQLLDGEGMRLVGLELADTRATLRLANGRYSAEAQAIGRAARAMSRTLPASVEEFRIVPIVDGMALSAVTVRRSDIEALEFAPAEAIRARAEIAEADLAGANADQEIAPRLSWSIAPYLQLSVFDPESPLRSDRGLRFSAAYRLAPGLVASGAINAKLAGNLDDISRRDESGLPRVRTDAALYSKEGNPALSYLTLTQFTRPAEHLYAKFEAGYLEPMFAGVASELLWKPVDSRLGFGVELAWARQRDFDQRFGLRDYDTVTGHASAYYDFGNGYLGQLDVGRYLAGDYGATVSLDREFANGWRVGAYATLTDAEPEDFGEGSFDKGIRITIPTNWTLGTASRQDNTIDIRSLTRDGGARLNLRNRLHDKVRDYHTQEISESWGRFWR
ncbi:YjbH domain-containing protein [Poseidonocella sedimentorum]|uniref:Exopolysaccharide biosynthesis protein YbjH n=1 Tax=Poseidonocella sedimentorum TaxID=871652 RepID=A0A1I6D991_9RHOB|nr:YjbH domain-containing protein [Poseidonocella sedimentorum]SFR02016.1 Exopolysaccharide biosynthesis protein YbjH [Poseidonocella sedimentorum]